MQYQITDGIEQVVRLGRDVVDYGVDRWERNVLFWDVMRKRGNNYLDHIKQDQPPVLVFKYDMILDGRKFDKPVNYALVKIIDRRKASSKLPAGQKDRRVSPGVGGQLPTARPIVVIDPRAGHGPGIGGSKLNSQIGVALDFGHPVYFILFFTDPEPGQTLLDVQQAEIRFLEEVVKRHPEAELPAVIGNCQAGWAAALIGADRPDIVGPMVFNGSPLSYWGGVEGANPMRYAGGLYGGVWLTSLWCDLGNGIFDGAHLVANFENLNPANTLWTKQYHLWSHIDTEEKRYLDFEKWWGGFFKMNREEIHFIVDSLFVGNELEQGFLKLQGSKPIHLKNFRDPIVVFASKGDNITPPQQALNWIYKVYGTVDEIKRHGQVIVYLLHERIGHLGIFVSGKVAEKEHKEIITSVRMLDYLAPGLYEMVIKKDPSKPWLNDHVVEFVERDMDDILALDDGLEEEKAFVPVSTISRFNDKVYQSFVSPFIRFWINEWTAEWIRQLHPLRIQRYSLSDWNPLLSPIAFTAPIIRENRNPVKETNFFHQAEQTFSECMKIALNCYRDIRDSFHELAFRSLYGNPWILTLFPDNGVTVPEDDQKQAFVDPDLEKRLWQNAMEQGGFQEAVVRVILAVMGANKIWSRSIFGIAGKIIQHNDRLKHIKPDDLKRMIKQQSAFINHDIDTALSTLTKLLPNQDDRIEAFEIANSIATGDMVLDHMEIEILDKLKNIFNL